MTAGYGVTSEQVAAISDGYPGGLWSPYQTVTRAQFAKMAALAFGIEPANPATPSFTMFPRMTSTTPTSKGPKPPVW